MLQSYTKSLQVGMTKQQVMEMYGPPDWEKGNRTAYSLGPRGLGVDIDSLIIEFDDNNKVTRFRLSRG
jgi:outer membrane protein assembly factor BamE (lipoprotein component of BamABCDE complex)